MRLTGAEILVESLLDQEVDMLFGYPGGSVLNIYDALYTQKDKIRHIVTSHEQGAAHAADGYARATGRTGVVIATSGPGATNLVTGIAAAYHDSVPLVAITGNVTWDLIGRDSFQEVDIVGITNPVVKHNYMVESAEKLPEILRQAFEIANSGRKGPVLIDIPKDVTAETAEYIPAGRFTCRPYPRPAEEEVTRAALAIGASSRPVIYCGGGVTFSDSAPALKAFAEKLQIPVCMSMMGLSSLEASSVLHLGLVGMHGTVAANRAVERCDLLVAVGARFSDRVAGDRTQFAPDATVIHIDIDHSEFSKNVRSNIRLTGHAGECLSMLAERLNAVERGAWMEEITALRAEDELVQAANRPRMLLQAVREAAGEDAVIVTDVGQHQMWTAQYYPFARPRTFLSSCGLGAMGYGLGAAIGAKAGNPRRPVVLITGDGSFHMNMAELAAAVTAGLNIVVLVMNNGVLGMVHQWQELFYSGRYAYTELKRQTDFVKLAEAFGAEGMRIENGADTAQTLRKAFSMDKPCVIDCPLPPAERVFPIIPPGKSGKDMIVQRSAMERMR